MPETLSERMQLLFKIDDRLDPSLVTVHAVVPLVIELFCRVGAAQVVTAQVWIKQRQRGEQALTAWIEWYSPAPRFPWTLIWGILPLIIDGGVHGEREAERGRFSSRKKVEAVLRLLRGEDLDLVSPEAGITAAKLSEWRDHFVTSGQAGLKSRAADSRDEELARLKALVGDLTMRLELSREAVSRLRASPPLAAGRPTR